MSWQSLSRSSMAWKSSLERAAMGPERMTHDELFLEIKRALNPQAADPTILRDSDLTQRYVSPREQARQSRFLATRRTTSTSTGCCGASNASGRHLSRDPGQSVNCGLPSRSFDPGDHPGSAAVLDKYKAAQEDAGRADRFEGQSARRHGGPG